MTLRDTLAEMDDEIMVAEGFDDAILGYATRGCGSPPVAVYDCDKCVQILAEREGISLEEAADFFEINVLGSWVGDRTPIYVQRLDADMLQEIEPKQPFDHTSN